MQGGYKLVKRPDSPYWAVYWSEGRKPYRRSTGAACRHEAEQFLANFILGRTLPQKLPANKLLVSQLLDIYALEKTTSKALIDIHLKHLKSHFGNMLVAVISKQAVQEYATKRNVKPGTLRRELTTLKAALNHAYKEGRVEAVPHIALPAQPPAKERWLTRAEIKRLFAACGKTRKSSHLKLFMQIALNTGQRKSAILELKWFQVDFEHNVIHFNPPGRQQTSKRRVSVPMNTELRNALKSARRDAKSEYVVAYLGRSTKDVRRAFVRLCKACGINDATPHTLRHTAGTWMAQAGIDMWKISGILGHSTSKTTELYLKHSPDHLRDAVGALSTGKHLANKLPKNAQKRANRRKK